MGGLGLGQMGLGMRQMGTGGKRHWEGRWDWDWDWMGGATLEWG